MLQIENQSENLAIAMNAACEYADGQRSEFLLPEHLLWGICSSHPKFVEAIGDENLAEMLLDYLSEFAETVPEAFDYEGAQPSVQLQELVNDAYRYMSVSGAEYIDIPHIIHSIQYLDGSYAKDLLMSCCDAYEDLLEKALDVFGNGENDSDDEEYSRESKRSSKEWEQFVICLNDLAGSHNPLIGREEEIERTVQVLCRKDKNNPLHVGEPGVGKTAIAYGLAARIESGDVPERLNSCKIYDLDLGAIMAGTQYRGEFEKRIKSVLAGLEEKGNVILYIDEIHNLIGAGRIEGGSLDAANMLKPYLESGTIRFMGATTYEEYNKTFIRNKGFARRFEKIDISEPSVDQCRLILKGLKHKYEEYHQVVYTDDAIEYAVIGSDKYITGRYLPDKAIDVLDDSGAWRELHKEDTEVQVVDRKLVAEVLARTCNVDTLAEDKDDIAALEFLEQHIKSQIYGQDEAVKEVTEAVQLASAGLLDENKPMASLLFVGPTGVGKTEVAKVLAKELSLPLIRFDMSEYAEKHTVAKMIGSPAGYVGYEDGGLLTDAIRKTPHCVLLFDELEKAHQDIYNILLQVMDYAVLTDNKGQKADFRHVIFIMTTNAGAQFARQGGIGFSKGVQAGDVMMKSVKQTFKPEFLNRLTGITIFHDMSRSMAELILDKKLAQLDEKLAAKNVSISLSDAARELMLSHGFSEEYGGREIDRVINSELKPILMRAMLFGALKNGGNALIDVENE